MGKKKKTPLELGRRERQIVETVVKLGEASVADVLKNLGDPPSYSSVRAMLGLLVEKKWLKFRQDGKRYLYRPAAGKEKSQRTAVSRLLDTFFGGSPTEALAALLDSSAAEMTDEEFNRMLEMVKIARKGKR
ncbi:MAG: BlaI/MecI/CopY family transcriptional regulator [Mariniblastus sp.]